ncbi:S8 family serine peptidase, partial [Aphanizomenon sp. UHCC 0183]|nr:S8 family serine peptidase [Aphanizomenon sp. UHCC 0183]
MIDVEALTLNTPTSDIINQGEAVYYRVDVAAGESLLFNFDGQYTSSDYGFTEFYVSYGKMPTRNNFDFIYQVPLEADQQILVPTTEAGTYYVMAYGNTVPEYTGKTDGFNYTIEAKTIDFAVLDTDFGLGGTAGNRTIEINGNKFDRSVKAYLRDGNGVEFGAEAYYFVDSTLFYPTFNLTQTTSGIYDVVVKNAEGDIFIVDDGFEVVNGGGADLRTYLDVPESVRRPQHDPAGHFQGKIGWYNQGLNDAYSPVLEVSSTAPISLDPDNIPIVGTAGEPFPGWDVTYLFGSSFNHYGAVEGDGPPGIIMPGQGDLLPFYGAVDPNPESIYTEVNIFQLSDPYPWEDVRDKIQPALMSDEEFEPIWEQLITQVGTTWGDYLEMLSRNANLLPEDLLNSQNTYDLIELELSKVIASVGTSISGNLFASNFDIELAGLGIEAKNTVTGDSFSTFTLNDGSFIFEKLTHGAYKFQIQDYLFSSETSQLIELEKDEAITGLTLDLEPGRLISGQVTQPTDSKPGLLNDTSIYLFKNDNLIQSKQVNSGGKFTFKGLESGVYTIVLDAENQTRTWIKDINVTVDDVEVDILLSPQSTITGNIVIGNQFANDAFIFARLEENLPLSQFSAIADANGNFTIGNLPTGTYNLVIISGDNIQEINNFKIAENENINLGTVSFNSIDTNATVNSDILNTEGGLNILYEEVGPALLAALLYEETYLRTAFIPAAYYKFGYQVGDIWQTFLGTSSDNPSPLLPYFDKDQIVEGYSLLANGFRHSSKTTNELEQILKDVKNKAIEHIRNKIKTDIECDQEVSLDEHSIKYTYEANINYNWAFDIPGNLAGGVGEGDQYKDSRTFEIEVDFRQKGKTVEMTFSPKLNVVDTVDFIPGDLGAGLEQIFTISLQFLEAYDWAYDVPFSVDVKFDPVKDTFNLPNINEKCDECPDGKPKDKNGKCTDKEESYDPNDIIGPDGFGEEKWVTANQPLNYTIRFENDAQLATAPAQTVRITQKLDSDLDLRTFRLGNFGFGEFVFEVPNNQAVYQDRLDLTATLGVYVDVFAGIDITTGEAFWELTAIDPETGEVPISVLEGFLPPNEDGLEGQGFVIYTIRAKGNVPTGTVIDAQADIIFDTNEPIITPPIFNTLDAVKPTSTITALPSNTEATEFVVQWTGEDTADGSGLASYTIYVSTNGGAFTPWLSETTDTEAIFTGEVGKTYEFYSVAIDNAGNRQNLPLEAQATIFIDGEITGSIGNFIWLDNNANGIQDTGESGLANVPVILYDNTNNAIATTTSDAGGFYRFTNIAIGDYTIKVTAPATYLFSPQNQGTNDTLDSDFNPNNGLTATFSLSSDSNLTLDAGLYQTATINGQVWNDIDGDGIKDAQEGGLKDWTVYLDANNNGEYNSGEITTVTDTQGNYRFSDLIPGTYTVAQVLQENWRQTYPVITTTGANIPLSIPTLELISPSNNQVQLNFSATEYIVEETGNAITEVIVTRTGDTSSSVSVTLTLSDGTAEGCGCVPSSTRTDFNYRSILITFAENEVSKVIPVENALLANPNAIRIRNDDKVEGDEYFTINLTNPTGGATIGTQGIAKVTIIDDEAPSNIRITESASSAIAPNNNNVSSPSETLSNSNANSGNTNAINLINLDDFWADSRFANIKGQGYTTVIIDTGADLNHPLFGPDNDNNGIADRIIYQYDFADNDNDAGDKNNHGSHITSIASQIAPESNLIVLKVFKDNGSGSFATLEKALQWVNTNATSYNVASVNLSLGDSQNWTTEVPRYGIGDELAAIASQNILIAAAAGNSFYTFNSTPGLAYPAADPNTISVGAVWADSFGSNKTFSSGATDYTTGGDAIASFSQRHPSLLDVFAPGIFIAGANATGGTQTMGGTSQATPFISGIAVLGQQITQEKLGRELTPTEFRTLLNNTSDFINDGDDENDNVTNTGLNYSRINLLALAEGILNLNSQAPNPGNSNTNINSSDDPLYLPSGSVKLTHTVTLTTGQIATDINFGNQRLNNAPILGNAIADQTVTEDTIFTFIIPENTFTDVDAGDILSYTATLETGLVLPSWLTFDAVTRTFSGTPTNSEVGSLNLKITATDKAGVTVNDTFVITVENINDAPTLANEIADQNAKQGTAFNFQIPTNTFIDIDAGDVLTYSATLENGDALPS